MKKLLTLLIVLIMPFTLLGCGSNNKEEQPQEIIDGGWVDVEDGTLTDELKEMFNTALEGLLGATYEPVELIATQVVSGTNYKFLASGSKTTKPVVEGTYYITIYKDLQGTVELKDIEVIEEKEKEKEVDKTINYWLVFYNPDGTELYREAIKYGTTPKYKGETPNYSDSNYWYKFVGWTDKKGNEIKEFKPIKGNTYIYAKYEVGGEIVSDPLRGDYIVTIHETFVDPETKKILDVMSGTTVTCTKQKDAENDGNGETKTLTFTYNGNAIGTYQYHSDESWGLVKFTFDGIEMANNETKTINADTEIFVIFSLDQPPM